MKFIKKIIEGYPSIRIEEDSKKLLIEYYPNGDLYWTIMEMPVEDKLVSSDFTINKKSQELYQEFEILFNNMESVIINGNEEDDEEVRIAKFRKNNIGYYNSLLPKNSKTITWFSNNDIEPKKANYMTITKEEESFKIEFKTQPNEKGEVEDTGTDVFMISVRIRTSGCRYAPFHIVFMRMFNRLIELPNFEVEHTKTDSIVLKKELSKKEV